MRPIKLELEGFTSFRQRCELNFSELDLFAITGPTGAGKSSLLDAITYALFGRTARLGKSGTAKELVSQNAVSMFVCLEFQAGSQVYKVYRGLKGKTSKGQLEKQSATGEWVPETGSIKQMDTAIEEIVGLKFEGFTRAVILPQGKFDEFLRGDTDKRREVLKALLGLELFGEMMKLANSKAQGFATQAKILDSQIEADVTDETRKQLEESITVLEAQESGQKQAIAKLEKAQSVAHELSQHRIRQETHRQEQAAAEQESRKLQSAVQGLKTSLEQKRTVLAEVEIAIAALAYDPGEHLRLTGLIPQVKRREDLNRDIAELKKSCSQRTNVLEADSDNLGKAESAQTNAAKTSKAHDEAFNAVKQKQEELLMRYGSAQQVRSLAPEIKGLAAKERELSTLQDDIQELQAELATKEKVLAGLGTARDQAEAARITAEQHVEHLQQKHRAVELRHELRPGEPCPVCEQTVKTVPPVIAVADLQGARRALKEAKEKYDQANAEVLTTPGKFDGVEKDVAHKAAKLKDRADSISGVHERVRSILGADPGPDSLKQLEDLAASIEQSQTETTRLEKQSRDSAKAVADRQRDVDLLKQQCANHREWLETASRQLQQKEEEYLGLEQELTGVPELDVLEKQFTKLKRDKEQKDHLERQQEQARSTMEKAQHDSVEASSRLEAENKRANQARSNLEKATREVHAVEVRLRETVAPLALPEGQESEKLREELNAANSLLRKLESERNVNQTRLGVVSEKLKKNRELREQCKQLNQQKSLYHELGTMLSADHFQDYMLRSSYKLLAREGSQYFKELTNGRYSFHSDQDEFSVRDHSNGDEMRSVSTLSGGESFLASLSLALALAQSIVELSGERGKVALESLFLDEGFSTLDPETLGKVADALPALQKKGRLIGIITHVESLAEQLPSRIEIVKSASGSKIFQQKTVFKIAAAS
jgi:exonuclease SbcC